MARVAQVPWSNAPEYIPGVSRETTMVSARVGDARVEAEAEKVSFSSLDAALTFFSGEQNLLAYLSECVSDWYKARALSRARASSVESAVASAVSGLVRIFVKRHGREPNDAELAKIQAKARTLVEDM